MKIIYSEDVSLIKLKLKPLIKNYSTENIIKISFTENRREQIETVLMNTNLHNQKKMVILEDASFLLVNKNKLENNFNSKEFWRLLSFADSYLDLVLTVVSNKILNNWPKNLNPNVQQIKPLTKNTLKTYLIKNIKPQLEDLALIYLVDIFSKSSIKQIDNEINKLNNLYLTSQILSLKEVKSNIVNPFSFDIFKMSYAFLERDLDKFLQSWYQGFNEELNIQQLFGLLAKQLIDLSWYFKYHNLGFQEEEIADFLNINPYYLKKLLANNHQQVNEINDRIKDIYNLNKKIIVGKIDKKIIPEYLFLKMFPHSSEREKNGAN